MNDKVNTGNAVMMGQLLEFKVAFPEEEPLTIEQYLNGGSRSMILKSAAFFLGFKIQKSKYTNTRDFLEMFFCSANNRFANQVYDRIKKFEKEGVLINILHPYSSLKLFEYFFSEPERPETQTQAEFEVNLFKAYLVLNTEFTEKQSISFPSSQESHEELKIPMMMFCMHYPVSDKVNYLIGQVWATQMIKSIYLFLFLESHTKTQQLLGAFLAHFDCETWQEYLKRLLPLTTTAILSEKEAHTDIVVKKGEDFERDCVFIEKLIVEETDRLDKNDFLTIRAKPFYKVKKGVYRIIFNLFAVEKVFKGVYFLLRDVNKTIKPPNRIKEIKSFFGNEFSEKILCYKVIESIYSDRCIRFSGKDLEDMKIDSAPDYYVRKGKNILLVESKDFLIAADKKMSFDFSIYEEEFGRILDYEEKPDGKIKPKAIMQLINNVRSILKKQFSADTDYHYKGVFIYPVLLTHDHQYDTPGFNELIDFWFQDELSKLQKEGLFIHRVKPLSVVNIDSIIYNQDGLSNSISLHEVLDLYHKNKKVESRKKKNFKSQEEHHRYVKLQSETQLSRLIPFASFIDKHFQKHGLWKLPPLLEIVTPSLFPEDFHVKEGDD